MPNPKKPTAAEKLVTMEQVMRSRQANGFPPSPQARVALDSFAEAAPTPEEIERVTNDLMRTNPQAALEFKVYAEEGARPANNQRQAAQQRYAAGMPPDPVVEQALARFGKTPPTPEQVQAVANQIRAEHGDWQGQQFETYAANMLQERAARAPRPEIGMAQNIHPTIPDDAHVVRIGQAEDIRPASPRGTNGDVIDLDAEPLPPGVQPQMATADPRNSGFQSIGAARNSSQFEPALVARAKDIAQGVGHIATLGAVPAPESVLSGNDRLRGMVGLEPLPRGKPRQGKTEGHKDPPRDKNKERDLLMEAKKIHAD
jgi:hypothetical protein